MLIKNVLRVVLKKIEEGEIIYTNIQIYKYTNIQIYKYLVNLYIFLMFNVYTT